MKELFSWIHPNGNEDNTFTNNLGGSEFNKIIRNEGRKEEYQLSRDGDVKCQTRSESPIYDEGEILAKTVHKFIKWNMLFSYLSMISNW